MLPGPQARRRGFILALAATVLMHGAAFAAFFFYRPPPLASIGVEAISVEIVVGSNSMAGDTDPQSTANVNSAFAPPEEKAAEHRVQEEALKVPEKPVEQLAAVEPPQRVEETTEPPKAEAVPQEKPEPMQQHAAIAPDMPETVTVPPKPESKPVEVKRETPKPAVKKPVEPKREAATRKRGESEKKTEVAAANPSDSSTAAKGFGIGRSDAVSNYPGLVRAHLMRFLPSVGESHNASATIRFTVSPSGSLVSASLVRSSGNSAADAAVQGMVRRASPFPAPGPTDGRDLQITINLK